MSLEAFYKPLDEARSCINEWLTKDAEQIPELDDLINCESVDITRCYQLQQPANTLYSIRKHLLHTPTFPFLERVR